MKFLPLFIILMCLSCTQKKLTDNKGHLHFVDNLEDYSIKLDENEIVLIVLNKSECDLCEDKIDKLVNTDFGIKTHVFSNDENNKYKAHFIPNKQLAKFNLLKANGFIFVLNSDKIFYSKNIDVDNMNAQINEIKDVQVY